MANDVHKIKLLVLWDILCKNTDENHAMNADEIREELAKRGISVMRKVVATDIAALNKYGYEVLSYKKKYYYYYVVSRPLETAEVVMLADVIKASKLTSTQKNIMIEKLSGTNPLTFENSSLPSIRYFLSIVVSSEQYLQIL